MSGACTANDRYIIFFFHISFRFVWSMRSSNGRSVEVKGEIEYQNPAWMSGYQVLLEFMDEVGGGWGDTLCHSIGIPTYTIINLIYPCI